MLRVDRVPAGGKDTPRASVRATARPVRGPFAHCDPVTAAGPRTASAHRRYLMMRARLRLGKSAADHLFVPLKAVLEKRWGGAAEIPFEKTRIEDDPISVQVDQVPRESSRRNGRGLEPNFDTSRPGIPHT